MKRKPVNRRQSVGEFRSRASKTHKRNTVFGLRGGIRL